jgi:hypothetical protein
MNAVLKNVVAVVVGIVIGSMVNMALITASGSVIAPPAGADVTTMEGLKASIHLFEPKHFLMPFLAHALGTLVGAFVVAKMGATRQFAMAMGIGALFFVGGAANAFLLPGPIWFDVVDIAGAYFPMAWIGWKLARSPKS